MAFGYKTKSATYDSISGDITFFRVCEISGGVYSVVVKLTDYERWLDGVLVQNAFPNLSAEEREFIITGTTPEEWDYEFGDDDELYG